MNNLLLPVGIAVLVALNILDVITTRGMIDSGKGFERNPVMAWLFKMLPKQPWWLPKLVLHSCRPRAFGLSAGLTARLRSGYAASDMRPLPITIIALSTRPTGLYQRLCFLTLLGFHPGGGL